MRLKRRVSLGGVQLDSLDNRILITGVDEAAGKDNVTGTSYGFWSGQRVTGNRRDTLDVTVKFTLAVKPSDMSERSSLLETIAAWAAPGGVLRLNYKPDRMLRVVCVQFPAGGDKLKFDSEYTVVFRAFAVPYWQNNTEIVSNATKDGTNRTVSMDIPGSVKTVAGFTIKNKSGAVINTVTVTAGTSVMKFESLGLGASESLVIDHVNNGDAFYLRIRKGTGSNMTSVLAKRTADSANDLYCGPGNVSFNVNAQRAVSYTVNVRGRFA